MRLAQTRRRVGVCATVLALLSAAILTGCAPTDAGTVGQAPVVKWVSFGPFEKPAQDANVPDLSGPADLRTPDGDVVHLDANELLGSGRRLPVRDDYRVTAESYSYTKDGDTPMIVGLVQTVRTVHYRGYTEDEYVSFVLGISTDSTPRELTRTLVFRGGEHTAAIAGRSDLGVVAIHLEGELNSDAPQDSRVVGIDAVRGTQVWTKEHGYPVFGERIATFYVSPSPDLCASEVTRYDVASGIPDSVETFPNTDEKQGGTCRTANDAADPA